MRQVIEAIVTPIMRALVAHPVTTSAVLVPATTAMTIAAIVAGGPPLQFLLLALLWLGIVALLAGIRIRRRHELAVSEAESIGGVVPPPPFVAGSGFWIGVFFTLGMLGAIGAFWNEVGIPAGHSVGEAVVTHTEVSDARGTFYDTYVNFVVDDEVISTSFVRYGRVANGDPIAIHYDPESPTIVEEAAPNGRYLVAGGFGFFAMLGLLLVMLTRPRAVDPAASLARVPGARAWRHRTAFDNGSQHEDHLWFSDGTTLRIWTTGAWTLNAIEHWLASGGLPSPQAHSSIAIPVGSIERIDATRRKVQIHYRKQNGRLAKRSVELNDPDTFAARLSVVLQVHQGDVVGASPSMPSAGAG